MNTTPDTESTMIWNNHVYFADNGAVLCGEHLGMTARMTGRDISGQPVSEITPDDVAAADVMGVSLKCETCGKKASTPWLASEGA